MEKAVGARRYGLVAVDAARAYHTDWGLGGLHHACLHRACVAAQQYVLGDVVGVLLNEEGVLHVAGWMVGGKVHLGEHVQVVLRLGSVGKNEAHAREYVDYLVGHNRQRMARAKLHGVRRARKVDGFALGLGVVILLLKGVYAVDGGLLQLVDFHSHHFLPGRRQRCGSRP